MRTFDVAVVGICAALYAVIGLLTSFGLSFGGVAFWPAAVIPAIFAVLFGPWVGATGASIGIFIHDMFVHGNPLLSLSAGVTGNFAMFFLIGYLARTNVSGKKLGASIVLAATVIVVSLLLPTILLPNESLGFTEFPFFETMAISIGLAVASLFAVAAVFKLWPQWRNYGIASVIGQGVGSAVLTTGLWAYSQLFYSPTGYIAAPISAVFAPIIFVWTFATEIPFVLLIGPPVIKAVYRAFPSMQPKQSETIRAT